MPPSVAQVRQNRSQRANMLTTVPGTLHSIDEFRNEFYENLSQGNMTGRRLGALLWRMPPFLLLEFNGESDPSAETISQLLQQPKKQIPSSDPQPQAEKIGLGFYHCLTSASPLLQGKLFLHTFSQGLYGIPSHQRGPMIPEAVKIATMGTRLLKEQADLLLFAMAESKADNPIWDHFYSYLRKVVLPLSMAKRRKRSSGKPLAEGSFMESTARTFGALWIRYILAPDFDANYAALWGKVWALFLSALEDGADHAIFRTPAKDDMVSVVYNILLAMVAVRPDVLPSMQQFLQLDVQNVADYGREDISPVMRRKMANAVAGTLQTAVAKCLPGGGEVAPGDGHRFLESFFSTVADKIISQDGGTIQKMKNSFSKEILGDLAE